MAVRNNLFTLCINRGDQLRPTGLDYAAFQKTCIRTSEPLGHRQFQCHPCRHRRRTEEPAPMAVENNLFTRCIYRGDQLRPTGLDCAAFQKT